MLLGVWAHPDDEAYLSAGLMAAAVADGERVVCVTATRGELGADGDLRERELAACLAVLGVTEHEWLGYADGGCADVPPAEPVGRLTELVRRLEPTRVVTFGPDGMTGHADHQAVGRWTTAAFAAAAAPPGAELLYATKTGPWAERFADLVAPLTVFDEDTPPRTPEDEVVLSLHLTGADLDRKVAALRAQASQVGPVEAAMGEDAYRAWVADEWFRRAPS